ncbi:MAG: hypothetical protein PHO75_00210 [Candidatus Shapirobacteria bacterium]|jgi:hypothetical protein|nr:hypothetical protein [Candidatus Shapirobacteria bacterium]
MNNKESIDNIIERKRQEIEFKKQTDIRQKEEKDLAEKERAKLLEIKRQQELTERIKKTRENFAGSGIIEAFEEIIDKKILILAKLEMHEVKKGIFGGLRHNFYEKVIPAKIQYSLNEVSLLYNYYYQSHLEKDNDESWMSINIEKIDNNNFNLKIFNEREHRNESIIGNSEKTIDRIADYIARNKGEPYNLSHSGYSSEGLIHAMERLGQ